MTNSSETNSKPIKKKGPLRTEALIPIFVIILLFGAYAKYFLDHHLAKAIEWAGTMANGAELNVGEVHTSFLKASFELHGLQVTDKNQPTRNLVSIGRIHFQFLWDALLRMKFVVNDASIQDISALARRAKPGFVVPPAPSKSEGPGAIQALESEVTQQAEKQFNKNLLGDVASILGGVDPKDQLKNIEGDLKSSAKIKELQAGLKDKEKEWRERIKTLPQGPEIDDLSKRIKGLKFDAKNPVDFANSVNEAGKILKEADQKFKVVSETGKALNSDFTSYSQSLKMVEDLVNQDLKDLQARLKIPEVNAGEFTKTIFMGLFLKKLGGLRKYYELAQHYMPPKASKEAKSQAAATNLIPPPRGQGKNYRFPREKAYPFFWLQHAEISSHSNPNAEFSGDLSGQIKDLTTDPALLGRPALIEVQGEFPRQDIRGVAIKITLDHTQDTPHEQLALKIASYPVANQQLVSSGDLTLELVKAIGGLDLIANLVGREADVQMATAFTKADFVVDSKTSLIKEILSKTLTNIPVIDLKASARGEWDKLSFSLSSNLGDELARGIKNQIQEKIDQAKGQLRKIIDEKIGSDRQKLNGDFSQIKDSVSGDLGKTESALNNTRKSAQDGIDKQKKQGGLKSLEEEGKKLLKQFNIGG